MRLRIRLLMALVAVVLMVAACTSEAKENPASAEALGASTSISATELETTSTSSTSTSSTSTSSTSTPTTLVLPEFDSQVIGSYVFAPVNWGIVIDGVRAGVHYVYMIVEVRPAAGGQAEALDEQIAEMSGQLVWDETVVDVCTVKNRYPDDPRLDTDEYQENDFMWIGDIFSTYEDCSDGTDSRLMRDAFDEFGLPEQACIAFISDGLTHELCEPLNELPTTYEWNWTG